MTDEHKLNRDTNRAARVEALLRNEDLQEAFAYLDKVFLDTWRRCEDPALRDELWRSQANLANLRGHLTKVLSHGNLAQKEIDLLAANRKRVFGVV